MKRNQILNFYGSQYVKARCLNTELKQHNAKNLIRNLPILFKHQRLEFQTYFTYVR